MDAADISGIGALAEPVRRALYTYVVSQPDAVGREEAASGVHVPVHTAKFHLDRLVDDGLLEVEYRRLSGKTGPGAGRPAKLYRRSDRQFTVSLPERRYDLVGDLLASAVQRAAEGTPLPEALHETAHAEGHKLGRTAEPSEAPPLDRLADTLKDQGFEPRTDGDTLVLANCPFDSLAQKHTELVCGLNLSYVQGVADGLGCPRVRAFLEPEPGHCCVKAIS
ncbi:helix-turn-helix transcriptional regulator [Labedaea rhizosphaerae]|uniref:Putative ArsR family transcriptional regulator n=1 Tax=Labedaea rhizosphaerae TaxID=598644 RepID=A0A4R6SFC7_LABRH|nr:helix-turn-helix domain-containing protein [Labedaea rhizosphaerae]TDP97796.1 putative ArsR family transcriptional regulator [Labedaea rhizosphaerae]